MLTWLPNETEKILLQAQNANQAWNVAPLHVVKILIWQIQVLLFTYFRYFNVMGGSFSLISVKAVCVMNFTEWWKLPWAQQWWLVCCCAHLRKTVTLTFNIIVVPRRSLFLTLFLGILIKCQNWNKHCIWTSCHMYSQVFLWCKNRIEKNSESEKLQLENSKPSIVEQKPSFFIFSIPSKCSRASCYWYASRSLAISRSDRHPHTNTSKGMAAHQKIHSRMNTRTHVHTPLPSVNLQASFVSSLFYKVLRGGDGGRGGNPWNDSWHDGSQSSAGWDVWWQHFSAWLWTSKAGGICNDFPRL